MATGLQSAATPYDKPMGDEHRKILKESRQALVEDMEPEIILRHMTDPHLFTEDERDKIMANNLTRQQRNEILLDILPRKGAGAYKVFKETIKKAHRPLLTILVEAENKVLTSELTSKKPKSPDLRRSPRQSADNKVLRTELASEQASSASPRQRAARHSKPLETLGTLQTQLLPLMNDFGNCWRDLGEALHLPPAILRNIDKDYRFCTEKAKAMLTEWMDKEGSNATSQCLVFALRRIKKNNIAEKLIDAPDCGEKNEEHEVTKSSEEIYKKPTNEKEVTEELQQRVTFEELQKLEERKILQEKIMQQEETIRELFSHLDNKTEQKQVDELANDETLRMKNNVRKNEEEIKEPSAKKQQKEKQAEASGMREDEGDKLHEERREEEDRINKYTSRICKLS